MMLMLVLIWAYPVEGVLTPSEVSGRTLLASQESHEGLV